MEDWQVILLISRCKTSATFSQLPLIFLEYDPFYLKIPLFFYFIVNEKDPFLFSLVPLLSHLTFFLQLFPSLFGSSSLHSSKSYCYSSSNHSSPFITLILPTPHPPILFSINWLLFPLHDYTTLFHLIHVPKKRIFSLLYFYDSLFSFRGLFIISYNFALG